jgi:hypothetical protein
MIVTLQSELTHETEDPMPIISTQAQFDAAAKPFQRGMYREFLRVFSFDPQTPIARTGRTPEECGVRLGTLRYKIFQDALQDATTIEQAFRDAKRVTRSAERDADVFIALKIGFIRLPHP